jgi:hypothetical protein
MAVSRKHLLEAEELQQLPELDELQVRVVRLSELGAALRPQPEPDDVPALIPEQARPAPQPARPAVQSPRPAEPPPRPAAPVPAARPTQVTRPPPAAAPRTAESEVAANEEPRSWLMSGKLWLLVVVTLLYVGWRVPTERYITPNRSWGYALGIIGGSLMLILLLYSLRKRYDWLSFLGSTPSWFRFHMILGIVGPLCILYHANFATGATNSNVALFSMLAVAGSGFVGRYIYVHIHHGLYGSKLELGELRAGVDGLKNLSGTIAFLPELVARIESSEQRLVRAGPRLSLLGFLRPAVVALVALRVRWQLHRYIRRALRASARKSAVVAAERRRLQAAARLYIDKRLGATRRVAAFEGYERLFSLWHALHIPLIFLMVIAAIIHVIAVHIY